MKGAWSDLKGFGDYRAFQYLDIEIRRCGRCDGQKIVFSVVTGL